MFYVNRGHRSLSPHPIPGVDGMVLLAQGSSDVNVERRAGPYARKLFDPQLYLAGLDVTAAETACVRLATYDWFAVSGVPAYDPTLGAKRWNELIAARVRTDWPGTAVSGDAEIAAACAAAIDFQQALGVEYVILPTPLIGVREDEAEVPAAWLDAGVTVARQRE